MSTRFRMALSLYINSNAGTKRVNNINSGKKPNSDNSMIEKASNQAKGQWNEL